MSSVTGESTTLKDKQLRLLKLLLERSSGLKQTARIRRLQPNGPLPLSFAQQRIWFLNRLVPDSPFYNLPAALRIKSQLAEPVLRKALNETVRRHEVLRASFGEADGKPVVTIVPSVEVPFRLHDLRHLDPVAREQEALRLASEDAQGPFDLTKPPLLRVSLLLLGENDYIFLTNMHHIVADGWSMGVLVREVRELCVAFSLGQPSPLPELEIQYADFAIWQRNRLAAGELQSQLRYWTRKLTNLPLLDLPTDFPRRSVQGVEGETQFVTFPKQLSENIWTFSRQHDVTLFVVLCAAFNALLHRYTGQDEIVIGEPVANRTRTELEPLIGFFVNSLVLRTDVSGDPTFRELLLRSKQETLESLDNEDIPFEVIVDRLHPERTMGRNPLFQVSLQFFSGADAQPQRATLAREAIHVEKGTATLDLAFDLINSQDGIFARVEYSTELFRHETIQRLISHYQNLLEAFIANPDLRLSEAPMLSRDEIQQIGRAGNSRTSEPQQSFTHVHELFEAQVQRSPESVAVVGDNRSLTYRELNECANQLAATLREKGIGPEKLAAICLDRSIEAIVAVLAVWKAGGAYLPLDPALPDDRLHFMMSDAKPVLIITRAAFEDRIQKFDTPYVFCDLDSLREGGEENPPVVSGPKNLAYVIYTSGSSGTPKGVMVEHGAISRHLQWMQTEFPLGSEDRTPFKYAFSFDVSIVEMWSPLLAGAQLVVLEEDNLVDVAKLAKVIHGDGITAIDVVPSMLAALLDQPLFVDSKQLRRVICGGEVMSLELLNRLRQQMEVEFVNAYGPTETTITATYWRATDYSDRVPIGRPAAGYSAYVVGGDLNLLPVGVPGELCIGGNCLARGYLGRPELTRDRFVPDRFSDRADARLYRTGDRCRLLDDGNFEFLGRIDDQVKLRGYRIELGEVESALAATPFVRSCAAAIVPDSNQSQLVAYVVPNLGSAELWPSVGEYFIYDELLYNSMTTDQVRMRAYRSAIERVVRGKTVIDIGTGADLALARLCLEAGAKRVYALEMLEDAYVRASRLVDDLGLSDRLVLIRGEARDIELPEKVDVCVSELIGTIGSSEGAIRILNDARRFLRPGGEMIPHKCITRVAAVSLPDELIENPEFDQLPSHYVEKVFESMGRRFDIRVCVKNLPASCLVSDAEVFEELQFDQPGELEQTTSFQLTLERDCRVDGLLMWVNLYTEPNELIDVLTSECNWLPVFFPVFSPGIQVKAGDTIAATASRVVEPGATTPDYVVTGVVQQSGESPFEFRYESRRNETSLGSNPFYRLLHDNLETGERESVRAGEGRRIREWLEIYDNLYDSEKESRDPNFDIIGWNSSYTGEPLGREVMREQVKATAARIAELGGERILEIGCGTGLLLFELAEKCRSYVGTDFSVAALAQLESTVRERGWQHVELLKRQAIDFEGFEPESFDVVVLNSVVQYFPGIDYCVRVLERACRVLRPGGYIFVGDVRNMKLLRMLHAGIELERSMSKTTVRQLRERIEQGLRRERELVIEPAFFHALHHRPWNISGVTVQIKRGWSHNELTSFRYDVVMQVGGPASSIQGYEELTWDQVGSVPSLRSYLREKSPSSLLVRGVPSARLNLVQRTLEELDAASADVTLGALGLEQLVAPNGVEPEEIWDLENQLPYTIQIDWAENGNAATYDVLCLAQSSGARRTNWFGISKRDEDLRPLNTYTNVLRNEPSRQDLAKALRHSLSNKLPEYMIPSTFVWLDALPLTPTGKVDRRALPSPNSGRNDPTDVYAPPKSDLERLIASVWSEVLGIEKIGIDSNFFNIGGHSLLAMQVVARLSDSLNLNVPLRLMFERRSIRGLAEAISSLQTAAKQPAIPRIVPAQRQETSAIKLEQLTDEQVAALLNRLIARGEASG